MEKVKVKMLRPINGAEEGSTAEYSEDDAKRLAAYGAVEILTKAEPAPANKAKAPPANKRKGS